MIRTIFLLTCLWLGTAQAGLLPEREAPQVSGPTTSALNESGNDFLKPEQAFKLSIVRQDPQTLKADFEVAPGYYLYRERISFKLKQGQLAGVDLPPGEMKHDPNFGDMEVYHHSFQATLHLAGSIPPEGISLQASYQGCSEKGLCYAPIRKTFDIGASETVSASTPTSVGETDQVRQLLGGGKLWLIASGFFGFGLLLAFTPCVFPMIPILSGIIVGQGQHPSRTHAFNLSLAYTLGMAVTYAIAGIAAGLSGHLISNALQTPWALGAGALVFVLLALSMFGFYELRLPSGMESKIAETTNRIKGGRFLGVFIMGALSALIVSPCVAAPLAGALLYIGQTHDVVLGGVALFTMALGMGVPLLAVGLSAGALLPKAGAWMKSVQNAFGVVMLGVAVWLISPVLPTAIVMGLWAALLIGVAIFLHALDGLPPHAGTAQRLGKAFGVIALTAGIALLIGAFAGSRDPLQPLAGLFNGKNASPAEHALPFKRIKSTAELDAAIQAAKGRRVMLDFYADWCVSCKEFERNTFSDARVGKMLENTLLLQADVTANTIEDAALLERFNLFGPPGIIFFDANGRQMVTQVVGYQDAEQFLVTLNGIFAAKDRNCPKALEC
ncbi:thiol:disulfide interchange protein DsbD [Novimethylophilus kurashikiensis]|uniref:Thiol:disulfide interchange protein DsbD n=1 Tax=Novimethylophilus kurashikiensis TaxID=1825523 RepID=A0A2R5F6S1_9PROT|nr:protein-disulfide reductase DsbD [Novimethylophilus kurashikiensis]GBG13952.1 thiol:disulfide interchange protein DsbD [Novimethylophilus kurashikiensis]